MDSNCVLVAEHIYKTYNHSVIDKINHEVETEVLKDFNITVNSGDSICIMGKSGCGKTTLLKVLGTIDRATGGEIYYSGKNLKQMSDYEIALLRRREIGFVFQDYNLFDHLNVEENIMVPMILDKKKYNEIHGRVMEYAMFLDICHILKKYPCEISGGEKQRTAIARALVNDPQIIFGDEPTGNLDSASAFSIMNYLEDINTVKKKALVIVTHDASVASYCKKVFFIKDGRMEMEIENSEDKESSVKRISEIMMCL